MQPLTICACDFSPFKISFQQPFVFGGSAISERNGFYLTLKTTSGLISQGEVSPLPGLNQETIRRVRHELTEIRSYLMELQLPAEKDALVALLRQEPHVLNLCPSVRFGVESAMMMLAAQARGQSLVEFLGGQPGDVSTAALLQGTHQQVLSDFKKLMESGYKVFKLKVGDRNIALDVKKVQDIRVFLEWDALLRLDANRAWNLKEACIFVELAGLEKIEFIEEPLNDITQLDQFYQQARMPVALDETLAVVRSGIRAPGRCSSPVAGHEGVKAYVLKPMALGLVPALDWIEEARCLDRKAVISSAFESPVGLTVLANLACLTGQTAGLGTERWFKNVKPLVDEQGTIKKESLG